MSDDFKLADIERLTSGKFGEFDLPCPNCSPFRKPINRQKKVLRIWRSAADFATFYCAHCGTSGYTFRDDQPRTLTAAEREKLVAAKAAAGQRHRDTVAKSHAKAAWLWQQSRTIEGSVAERYLRDARYYRGAIPPTLRFLPARDDYPPAMIAAFGLLREVRIADDGTSVLQIDVGLVRAVHLTKLRADGSGKADVEAAKIIIGKEVEAPIWLAPITDSMALAITEGIEDALSLHQATGLGAWAAGSASRLPALGEAVPDWIDVVTIAQDADDAGRRNVAALAGRLVARGIEVLRVTP